MAKERGLDTYVVFWSIFVSEEFSKAHGVAKKNFYPHYYVDGDTSDVTKRYLRESVTQMLDGIPGSRRHRRVARRRHGRHDAARSASSSSTRCTWRARSTRRSSRPVKLIHRVPFSSGLSSGPGVSADVEKITRAAMEKLGNRFAGPIWVEMKFNWSHGHSTPKLVKVHGGKLGDTYFKPLPANYQIVWQVRNEDFFALRWGVPDFIRQHIARQRHAGLRRRLLRRLRDLHPRARLLHGDRQASGTGNTPSSASGCSTSSGAGCSTTPSTPDAVFAAEFTRRYGAKARPLLDAYALASNTQLRLASLFDSRWDFTLYSEGFLALQGEETHYIGVDALIKQPTLDPDYVSVADYVKTLRAGGQFGADRMTPDKLATAARARQPPRARARQAHRLTRQRLARVRSG